MLLTGRHHNSGEAASQARFPRVLKSRGETDTVAAMPGILHALHRDSRRLYIALLSNCALFGVTMTLVGASLPRLIRAFSWSYTVSGAVLAAGAMGYFVTTFVVGLVVHRFGSKRVLVVGLAVEALGLFLLARHPSPVLNMILNFGIGIGQGCAEVVTNFGVIRMERPGESRLMNLVHASFCVGGVIGPLGVGAYIGLAERGGFDWRLLYPVIGALVVVAVVMFARLRFPDEPQPGGSHPDETGASPAGARVPTPVLALLTLMLLCYVGAELGFSSWVSEYFVVVRSATPSFGALMVSVLWLGVLAGRLGFSFWFRSDRQDLAVVGLAVASGLSILLLRAVGTLGAAVLAVLLTGLGFSGVYPMVMTLVGRWFRSARAVGIAATGGGLGSFLFPFLMGFLGEILGIESSILFCAAATGLLAIVGGAVIVLRPRSTTPTAPTQARRHTE